MRARRDVSLAGRRRATQRGLTGRTTTQDDVDRGRRVVRLRVNASYDIVVVGGGPAGLASALWAARYRRSVLLIDAGQQRNRWSTTLHGYLGADGEVPGDFIARARCDLLQYGGVDIVEGRRVVAARPHRDGTIELVLDDGRRVRAWRTVLASGVQDRFPAVAGFDEHFGRTIFTCPSCDGYEARGKRIAVIGDSAEIAEFAVGLLDWATSVVLVREHDSAQELSAAATENLPLETVRGNVTRIDGDVNDAHSLHLDDGRAVPFDVAFWLMPHEHQSDLGKQLGCDFTPDGCMVVDDNGQTTVNGVYAAGDIVPGPHLVQVAAASGARAGIAAAASLRGHPGSPHSPVPAPDPTRLTER